MKKKIIRITEEDLQNIVKNIFNILHEQSDNSSIKLIDIEDKEVLQQIADEILSILTLSYQTKKIAGLESSRRFVQNTDMLTICQNGSQIEACAIYRTDLGGNKMTHCGCLQTQDAKIALKEIVKRDIKEYGCGFWVEASGVIEHWFKKYNGYPIPNTYAPILLAKEVVLNDDGFHYKRVIGDDTEESTKMIFGFRDEEFYQTVVSEFDNYEELRMQENLKEALSRDIYPREIRQILLTVANIFDQFNEHYLGEITPRTEMKLKSMYQMLQEYQPKDRTIAASMRRIDSILENYPRLELHAL